jgi:uncharacterized protein (DUF2249 family)
MSKKTVTLDVRADFRQGREPFTRIMQAVARLTASQDFVLLVPFEPVPLFAVLAQHGFCHETRQIEAGDCEVRFFRPAAPAAKAPAPPPASSPVPDPQVVALDVRQLEPPQPLVQIREALATLPHGTVLQAHTGRRPMHLYPQLEARGFAGESVAQPDGSFSTHIHRLDA